MEPHKDLHSPLPQSSDNAPVLPPFFLIILSSPYSLTSQNHLNYIYIYIYIITFGGPCVYIHIAVSRNGSLGSNYLAIHYKD